MRFWPRRETRSVVPVPEITSGATIQEWGEFWGQGGDAVTLPIVTIDTALQVPAVLGAVMFLSRTLAALPLHAYRTAEGETEKADGELQMLLN